MFLTFNGHSTAGPQTVPVGSQCPDSTWTASDGAIVDTSATGATGSIPLYLVAINAAGLATSDSETIHADNHPVAVSLTGVGGLSPTTWVNHSVTVDATPSAGPSGVGGTVCSVDGATAQPNREDGLLVDGDGTHTVSCTAWNNAVDPEGQHNTGTASLAVYVDEVPPSIVFEPRNAFDPTEIIVDVTDHESGVAGGSIQIAPAGTDDWTSLPTTFTGEQIITHLDDDQPKGPYVLRATSCDKAGNCGSDNEVITFPLRIAPDFKLSLTRIAVSSRRRVIYKRVLIDWHWSTILRHGRPVRVKRGGHFETVRILEVVQLCETKRVRAQRHRSNVQRICASPQPHITKTLAVPYGHSVPVYGLLTTADGVPLPGQSVDISVAVDNHMDAFHEVATATTDDAGSWTATLPPGPSRIIRATTDGTATILPSSDQVTTLVPAKVKLLNVWPRHVAWGGTVHLVGQLVGGYLPPGGALVRLRIGYGSTYSTYGVEEHVTGTGRFSTVATFGPGDPSILRTYWFQIASLPMGNYPYAPGASQRVPVIVGGHPG